MTVDSLGTKGGAVKRFVLLLAITTVITVAVLSAFSIFIAEPDIASFIAGVCTATFCGIADDAFVK